MIEALIAFLLPFAAIYYFFFGGKEKLSRYLFNKKSLAEKVEIIMKKDLSPKCARAAFYIGNNYHHKINQTEWQKYCQERVDPALDKNTPEYAEAVAPIVNAIVVGEYGGYLRRGMEDMSNSLQRFQPGVNDDISLNYFIEPYKYYKHKVAQQPQTESTSSAQSERSDYGLRRAEENYKRALRQSQRFKGTKWESIYAKNEKEAFAELLSEQAKYGK